MACSAKAIKQTELELERNFWSAQHWAWPVPGAQAALNELLQAGECQVGKAFLQVSKHTLQFEGRKKKGFKMCS